MTNQRPLRIQLLLSDRVLLDEALVAFQIQLGIGQQRLVATQVPLHLLQGRFVRTRIDLCQRIAPANGLALRKQDLLQDAADLSPDRYSGERRYRTQGRDSRLNISGSDRCNRHGYRHVLPAASATCRRQRLLVTEIGEQSNHQAQGDRDGEKCNPMPAHESQCTARLRWRFRGGSIV